MLRSEMDRSFLLDIKSFALQYVNKIEGRLETALQTINKNETILSWILELATNRWGFETVKVKVSKDIESNTNIYYLTLYLKENIEFKNLFGKISDKCRIEIVLKEQDGNPKYSVYYSQV
jgi:hypothetical protein